MKELIKEIRKCKLCKWLPLGPNPILSVSKKSKILIIWQAPWIKVHNTNIPWNDPSWERLREWLWISNEVFYNSDKVWIMPMWFCYPWKWKTWDLPPRKECAPLWHKKVIDEMKDLELIILIGQYAQKILFMKTSTKNTYRYHKKL